MTNILSLLQESVPLYSSLSDAAEKCAAELEKGAYDSVENYLKLRQSILDTHIAPRMAQVALKKMEPPGTNDVSIVEMEEKIKDLILRILEQDRYCMEKIQAKRNVLQSSIRELRDGVRAVHGYGHPTYHSDRRVKREA